MCAHPNFADPEYEPTDDELRELAREAYAAVAGLRVAADARMRERIAEHRIVALARLASRGAAATTTGESS